MTFIGSSVPRREDDRMLTGRGGFLADLVGSARQVVFVRSPHAHALIEHIDVGAALRLPGVVGVYTGSDLDLVHDHIGSLHTPHPGFAKANGFSMAEQQLSILPVERVHYVGQAVVAVVAVDRYVAEDAAELVTVGYSPLPPVLDPEAALSSDAPLVHPHLNDNEAARISVDIGKLDGLDGVAEIVEGTYRVGRHGAVPLETRGVIARTEAHRVTVWTSTQIPHKVRRAICRATGWTTDEVRIIVPDVGGGFGTKANVYAEEVILARLSRTTGEDLAWVEDRQEHLVSSAQGRDQVHHTRLHVDAEGHILAWEDDFVIDIGAGSLWVGGIIANTAIHLLGPYRVPVARLHGRAAFTTKTIVAQYRGAGRPEASFALERTIDAAAARLGLSPEEIRHRNLLTAEEMPYSRPVPYRDGVPIAFDGGDYRACLDAVTDLLPRGSLQDLRAQYPGADLGYGLGCYIEATGRGPYESARLRLTAAGTFEVASGAASAGQAHETVFAQVAADALGVEMARVRYLPSDTDTVAHGVGTFASRSAVLAGSAIRQAAQTMVTRARDRAAHLLGVPAGEVQYGTGRFSTPGGPAVDWEGLALACGPDGEQESAGPLDVVEIFRPKTVTWTMGVHAAVVAVQRSTGQIRVVRYAVAHEGGAEINPQVVEGQLLGGVAQGIGGTLLEEFRYAPDGQPQSTTFADYLLPSTGEVPDVAVRHLQVATPDNPLGIRGAGESGTIAAAGAIAGAVDDAVGTGLQVNRTPISPARVRAALQGARGLETTGTAPPTAEVASRGRPTRATSRRAR